MNTEQTSKKKKKNIFMYTPLSVTGKKERKKQHIYGQVDAKIPPNYIQCFHILGM